MDIKQYIYPPITKCAENRKTTHAQRLVIIRQVMRTLREVKAARKQFMKDLIKKNYRYWFIQKTRQRSQMREQRKLLEMEQEQLQQEQIELQQEKEIKINVHEEPGNQEQDDREIKIEEDIQYIDNIFI